MPGLALGTGEYGHESDRPRMWREVNHAITQADCKGHSVEGLREEVMGAQTRRPCWVPSIGGGSEGVQNGKAALALRKCGRQLQAVPILCSATIRGNDTARRKSIFKRRNVSY